MKLFSHVLLLAVLMMAGCAKRIDPIIGTAVPAWRLKDLNGNVVSSEQFTGKVLVVDFWATYCPPCREEMPDYVELQKKYGKEGVVFVGVSVDDGPEVVKEFVTKMQVTYQILMADPAVLAAFGNVDFFPTTFIIDRSGKVRAKKLGIEPLAAFEQRLLAVLK